MQMSNISEASQDPEVQRSLVSRIGEVVGGGISTELGNHPSRESPWPCLCSKESLFSNSLGYRAPRERALSYDQSPR